MPFGQANFYLDDGYIICKADAADRVLTYLMQVFSDFGLELNETKLQVWTAQPSQLPVTLRAFYNPEMTVLKDSCKPQGTSTTMVHQWHMRNTLLTKKTQP